MFFMFIDKFHKEQAKGRRKDHESPSMHLCGMVNIARVPACVCHGQRQGQVIRKSDLAGSASFSS